MSHTPSLYFDEEIIHGVTVIRFREVVYSKYQHHMMEALDQLYGLVEKEGRKQFLLNFSIFKPLESIGGSPTVGNLLRFHMKVTAVQGTLKFCHDNPGIRMNLQHCGLDRHIDIYDTEEA